MMLKPYDPSENDDTPPECRATVDLIQRALDGDAARETMESLDTDPHAAACPSCRDRVRSLRMLHSVLSAPREPVAVPDRFAERIAKAVERDRQVQTRWSTRTIVANLAACAACALVVLLSAYAYRLQQPKHQPITQPRPFVETAEQTVIAPPPREKTTPAPDPRPIRISDEFAKAGQSLLEAPKPLTESVAVAPKLLDMLTEPFKLSSPDPMIDPLEPARQSLTNLPTATRAGLEPVTYTAEKAYNRFLRDVGAVTNP